MASFVVKNASFWISKSVTPVAATAVTAGATTQVTVPNTLAIGDYAIVTGTGWAPLDGKVGQVTAATATQITLDIDTSGLTSPTIPTTKVSLYGQPTWIEACMSGFDYDAGTADTISVGTFCDPSAALAGAPPAASLSMTGFIDEVAAGFKELRAAAADGVPRLFKFIYPGAANPGALKRIERIFVGTVGTISESLQVGAAATFTANVVLSAQPKLFNVT
jgi:hypothetical protein